MIRKILIVCESIFLCLGVYLPLAVIDEFWVISSEFSILSLSGNLLTEKEWTLGIVVFYSG